MFPLLGLPRDSKATALNYSTFLSTVMERKQIYCSPGSLATSGASRVRRTNQQDADSTHPEHQPAWLQR